jgi:aryl-alcohol dehydrogenase-like predicted oxidoreductase
VSEADAGRILNAVLDAGINFIDTANCYGISEMLIGRFISHRRSEFVLASKCGCQILPTGDHDITPHIFTRENLLRNIDDSLSKLRTDVIDVYQLHNPTYDQVVEEGLVDVLEEIKTSGKIRHIGVSTVDPQIQAFIASGHFATFQIPYSALDRRHERLIATAAHAGAGTIIRGGVHNGEPGAGHGSQEVWSLWEKARLDELRDPGDSRTAFLLRFLLGHPDLSTTIIGTKNPDHLAANLKTAEKGPLPADVRAEAQRRLDEAGNKPI